MLRDAATTASVSGVSQTEEDAGWIGNRGRPTEHQGYLRIVPKRAHFCTDAGQQVSEPTRDFSAPIFKSRARAHGSGRRRGARALPGGVTTHSPRAVSAAFRRQMAALVSRLPSSASRAGGNGDGAIPRLLDGGAAGRGRRYPQCLARVIEWNGSQWAGGSVPE